MKKKVLKKIIKQVFVFFFIEQLNQKRFNKVKTEEKDSLTEFDIFKFSNSNIDMSNNNKSTICKGKNKFNIF